MNIKERFANLERKFDSLEFIIKIRGLSEVKRVSIFFAVMGITAAILGFWAFRSTVHNVAKIKQSLASMELGGQKEEVPQDIMNIAPEPAMEMPAVDFSSVSPSDQEVLQNNSEVTP